MLQDGLRNRTSGLNFSPTTLDLGDLEKDPDIARPPSVQGVPKKSTHCLDSWQRGTVNSWMVFRSCLTQHSCCCSVAQSCLTLGDPMDCSTPGFPVLHYLLEFAQSHVHCVSDTIQLSHPLSSPSLALNLPQHQGLFQRVSSLHQVAKVL